MSLGSNGTIMSRSLAKELLDAGLDSISFSIAGISAAFQDPLRGVGTYEKAMRSIKCFVDSRSSAKKPPILINYLLTPENIKRLPQAMSLCAKLGVDTLVPTHMVHVADPYQGDLVTYNLEAAYRWPVFLSRLAVLWTRVALIMPSLKSNLVPVCAKYPVENTFVGADGSVSPCVYLNPPLVGSYPRLHQSRKVQSSRLIMGNLNHDDLDTIWKRPKYQAFRQAFKKRIEVYKEQMIGITPDLEGMERLQKGVDRLQKLFETRYPAPEPCRNCPHLLG